MWADWNCAWNLDDGSIIDRYEHLMRSKWKVAVLLSGGTFDKIWRYYAKTNDEVTR